VRQEDADLDIAQLGHHGECKVIQQGFIHTLSIVCKLLADQDQSWG
jgi:hypothetical protein